MIETLDGEYLNIKKTNNIDFKYIFNFKQN